METVGGETSEALTCPRDGVETRLKCPDCRTPICPSCFVRTPVGLKCETCAAPVPAAAALARGPRRGPLLMAAIVAVVAVAGGAWALFGGPGRGGSEDEGELDLGSTQQVPTGPVVAAGEAPDRFRWEIQARIDEQGRVCWRLHALRGRTSREGCEPVPSGRRPLGPVRSRASYIGGKTTTQTWMAVSDQTHRVRTINEDGTTSEEPTIASDAVPGVRFFNTYVNRLQAVTFVALGPNGEELGRTDPPPLPPPPGR